MRIGSLNGEVLYVGRVFAKNMTSCYSLSEIAGLDNITDNQYYLSVRAVTNELGLGSPSEGILVYLTKADGSSTPRGKATTVYVFNVWLLLQFISISTFVHPFFNDTY